MAITTEETVGQLVAANPARARVFEKHRIDFCCGGKIPLDEACAKKGVSPEQVRAELAECDRLDGSAGETDWTQASLTELADHIISTHHEYLRAELPRIDMFARRVAKVHGDHAPETIELSTICMQLRLEMEEHTKKEEGILFPWIKNMEAGSTQGMPFAASIAQPIACMEEDHDSAGAALERIHALTNGFQPPADACNTWRVLYASLEELTSDLHVHVHKENSILFPRALELERAGAQAR